MTEVAETQTAAPPKPTLHSLALELATFLGVETGRCMAVLQETNNDMELAASRLMDEVAILQTTNGMHGRLSTNRGRTKRSVEQSGAFFPMHDS